jgi:hypothetical protein
MVTKIVLWSLVGMVAAVGLYLGVMTATDYHPSVDHPEKLIVKDNSNSLAPSELKILDWNIGYCGLGAEADFFMDGGTSSLAKSKEYVLNHLTNIIKFLKSQNADVYNIQEIGVSSRRSYHVNQLESFDATFTGYSKTFAYNYKSLWVPVPLTNPMGDVNAGLITLNKYKVIESYRYQYPGNYPWPINTVQLDRCFIVQYVPIKDSDKYWVIINSHNSAYDKGGKLRKQQLDFLKNFILKEYQKGNYVVVGADWNHVLPGVDDTKFKYTEQIPDWRVVFPSDWTPKGWKWGVETSIPTCRSDRTPYKKGVNFVTIIDGFLVSPNVEIKNVKGFDLGFKDSDHNPVEIVVKAIK